MKIYLPCHILKRPSLRVWGSSKTGEQELRGCTEKGNWNMMNHIWVFSAIAVEVSER